MTRTTTIITILCKLPRAFAHKEADQVHSHHGWAAARADLDDTENKKQFEDVYKRLADFFVKNQ